MEKAAVVTSRAPRTMTIHFRLVKDREAAVAAAVAVHSLAAAMVKAVVVDGDDAEESEDSEDEALVKVGLHMMMLLR